MKTPHLQLFLLAFFAASFSGTTLEAATAPLRTIQVSGTVFNDTNRNGILDRGERSGLPATVWLYRAFPNGTRVKIGQVGVNASGQYVFNTRVAGVYFIAVRFSNTFAVRSRAFGVTQLSRGVVRNVPFVTPQTVRFYPGYTATPNPSNLDRQQPVSAFAP